MSLIKLTLTREVGVPLEAEVLCPDTLVGLTNAEVRALPVYLGNRQCRLDDFFMVEGERSDDLEIHGDLRRVKWIGRGMTRGSIKIHGDVGMHAGAFMKGGSLEVVGSAGDWLGAEMAGGMIRIHGNASGQVGAAYRGSLKGMTGGTILIDGSAGIEVGMRMRRGIIAIKGPVLEFAGLQMKGGTLFLCGGADGRTGAWMARGTIVSLQPLRMLPTFAPACVYQPTFLRIYVRHLVSLGWSLPCEMQQRHYRRYSGDLAATGKGEILVWEV